MSSRLVSFIAAISLATLVVGCADAPSEVSGSTFVSPKNKVQQISLEAALDKSLLLPPKSKVKASCPSEVISLNKISESLTVECGAVSVPSQHQVNVNKTMSIGYMYVSSSEKQKPLLVIEQGGPGSSSMKLLSDYLLDFPTISDHFNLLAVDQRGTTWTRPKTDCPIAVETALTFQGTSKQLEQALRNDLNVCVTNASQKMDLSNINSFEIASDIVLVAQLFKAQKFSFYGVSYGGVIGQYLLKYYPKNLDRVVLDSAPTPNKSWKNTAVKNMDNIFYENLLNYQQHNKDEYNIDLNIDEHLASVQELTKGLMESPLPFTFKYKGVDYQGSFDAETFITLHIAMLTTTYTPSTLFHLLSDVRDKKTGLISSIYPLLMAPERKNSRVAYNSILCREFPQERLLAESLDSWEHIIKSFPPELIDLTKDSLNSNNCDLFNTLKPFTKKLTTPVSTDKSVLVMGGELDHVVSTNSIYDLSKNMPKAHRMLFPDLGHGVFAASECTYLSTINYLTNADASFVNLCE